jgi:hypothetical protein
MKSFSLLILSWSALTAVSETRVLPMKRSKAIKGGLSDQDMSVLSTKDLEGTTDDWDKYIEVSAGKKSKFTAQFCFASDLKQPIQTIRISTNTIGLTKGDQRRFFQIRNFGSSKWEYLGDNDDAEDWVWFEQEFILQGKDLMSSYFTNNGLMKIRFRSTNKADVCNLNYLKVQVTDESGGRPHHTSPCYLSDTGPCCYSYTGPGC